MYYRFLDSIDLSQLTSNLEPTQFTEVKKNGKTYKQPINIRSLVIQATDEKLDLYFNIKNNNHFGAIQNVQWFQKRFNLVMTRQELMEWLNDVYEDSTRNTAQRICK